MKMKTTLFSFSLYIGLACSFVVVLTLLIYIFASSFFFLTCCELGEEGIFQGWGVGRGSGEEGKVEEREGVMSGPGKNVADAVPPSRAPAQRHRRHNANLVAPLSSTRCIQKSSTQDAHHAPPPYAPIRQLTRVSKRTW